MSDRNYNVKKIERVDQDEYKITFTKEYGYDRSESDNLWKDYFLKKGIDINKDYYFDHDKSREIDDDSYEVVLKKYDDTPPETDLNPTWREHFSKDVTGSKRPLKIILTLFLDLYGIFHRLTSNNAFALVFSIFQFLLLAVSASLSIEVLGRYILWPNEIDGDFYLYMALPALYMIIWIIDIISIIVKKDIVFLGRIRYKDFNEIEYGKQ